MSYLHDAVNGGVVANAVTIGNVTTTTTGPAADMLKGDGVCNLFLNTQAGSIVTLTAQVWQSTASTGTYSTIAGATCAATTIGIVGVPFVRDQRWLQVVLTINGSTSTGVSGMFLQGKKSIAF